MELFLNLLWVAIAVVAFGFWRTRWLRERPEHRRNPLREWTAFACALVLLFFAVSLTDDLHSELIIFDECCASRRHSGPRWSARITRLRMVSLNSTLAPESCPLSHLSTRFSGLEQ